MKKLINIFVVLSVLTISSCSEEENKPSGVLVEAESFRTFTASSLQSFIAASGIMIDATEIKYDVEIFKVKYRTSYKGDEIIASGLVILPLISASEEVGMVSFQHGTLVAHEDAPSLLAPGETIGNLYAALASPGFITVIPDFVGFGSSTEISHPYYVEEVTASAIIDNLRAARELADSKKIKFNEDLYLAGYSQGGYATLATHKAIEENAVEGFNLVASFPASGGYDVKGMQEYFFSLDTYHEPFYIAYVAHAYTSYYNWNQPYSNFFKSPYAEKIDGLFDGTKSASFINDALTDNINELIQPDLLDDINVPKFDYIKNAFIENSLLDWTPTIPVHFYHGDADITVPYQNSVDTYEQLLENGTPPSIITFTTLPGEDHASGIYPYLENFLTELLTLN